MPRVAACDRYFQYSRFGSSFRTECFAGLSTFLSLSYIFVVNPAILSAGGMDPSMVFFATIVGSVTATLVMGLWANKPFAVAPGLEMNAYVAYVVIGSMHFTWQQAMGAVFWSGVLTVFFNYTRVRVRIIEAIPDSLKSGLATAVGVFLILIGLKVSHILAYDGITLLGIGTVTSNEAIVCWCGLLFVIMLRAARINGAVLLSIAGASVVAHFLGVSTSSGKVEYSDTMYSGLLAMDLSIVLDPKIWSVIVILFILDFYGSIAKFIGLTRNTSILDENGNMPQLQEALTVDGAGTVLGASLGTSNLITYVESAVGIGEGGRTGLTAVVCGLLMAMFLFLLPVLNFVPVVATTGALIFVGCTLFPSLASTRRFDIYERFAHVVLIVVTVLTFALDKAMFAGFLVYCVSAALKRERNWYLFGSTALLFVGILLAAQ